MAETLNSFLIFLHIWFKELKHDFKNILKYRVKFIATLLFAVIFMSGLFIGFYRIIIYIKDTPMVGTALVGRVIGMIFLSLFIMLIYSSVITAFSTLFLSRDNNFLIVSPFDWGGILLGKLVQTTFYASWMSCIVIIPLFGVLEIIFKLPVFSIFIIIPGIIFYFFTAGAVGLIVVIGVVKIFPARKVRDLLVMGFVVLATSMYIFFRFLNLEQILRPGQESIATSYLRILELPHTPFLPSYWISRMVIEFINNRAGWPGSFLMLSAMGVIFVWLFYIISKKYFYNSWEKIQSEEKKRFYTSKFSRSPVLAKDIKTFFRDTRQWTQFILILALIIIYIVNIYKLPLDLPYLHYLVAFVNIGMIGVVIASIGLRFSFSSISLEGKCFWILLSSPFNRKKILIQKYIENFIPIAVISLILIVVSNLILKPPGLINLLSVVTVFVFSITITSMGIGMGSLYPKFDAVNPAEVESSWGAILYMIYSFFYIGITLAFEAVWVRMYFLNRIRNIPIYYPAVIVIIGILLVLNVLANVVSIKLGLKNLNSVEI